jgi:hypothetical protein
MLVLPWPVVPYSFEAGASSTSTLTSESVLLEESMSMLEAAVSSSPAGRQLIDSPPFSWRIQCSSSWLRSSTTAALLFRANFCNSSKLTVSLNVRSSWIFCSRGNRKAKYRTSAGLSNPPARPPIWRPRPVKQWVRIAHDLPAETPL